MRVEKPTIPSQTKSTWFKVSALLLLALATISASAGNSLLEVNFPALVARADLHYTEPAARSEAGLPVGNGRMGSLVWTTSSALRLQVNRVDVFASNCASDSFPERHTDYCGGCGLVDLDFGNDVFRKDSTTQHLSCYDGVATVGGAKVKCRTLAWSEQDVMAIEVTDERATPGVIGINLRRLRAPLVRTGNHTARSRLQRLEQKVVLTQTFEEDAYYCASAVAVGVLGREAEATQTNESEFRLVLKPGPKTFTVLIASAASFSRHVDVMASALAQLAAAADLRFASLLESNMKWWHEFWAKSFIHLHSEDGAADEVERNYTYYLYLMASTSRGRFSTKFNGMLWSTGGDRRQWGAQFWGANQSCLYNNALLAANHPELLEPLFDMYSGMLGACSLAAKQQWGSQGAFLPETVAFDGLAPLPEDIAAEMRDLYLLRKPWQERSKRFLEYATTKPPHSSRWNWIQSGRWENGRWVYQERGGGPFGPVTHIFSRGAKIAYQYWLRYEYTQDESWLRARAYPMLKSVAEFYRHFPNVKKGEDGKYHIHNVNSNESVQGAQDTDEEIASMRGIFPVLIKASQLLDADSDLRPVWQEFLADLAPLPRSDHPQAEPSSRTNSEPVWIRGLPPAFRGSTSGRPDGNTMPEWFFDLCTLESEPQTVRLGQATLGSTPARNVGVLSKIPLVAAIMGRGDAVRTLIPAQINNPDRSSVLANRMDLREGAQTTSAQRLGNASDALHTALCYDLPSGPGQTSIIRVFGAWPKEWDAEFTLLCRGGFLVTSAMRKGQIEFVEIHSQVGGECRVRNPWSDARVTPYRDGQKAGSSTDSLLRFSTRRGEHIVLVSNGTLPEHSKRMVPSGDTDVRSLK